MPSTLVESIKPYWRAMKYGYLGWSGRRAVSPAHRSAAQAAPPMAFIIGCGRSGTTLLGEMLAAHPDVAYLNEPYHLWAAIDRRTDCTGMYQRRPGRAFLDAHDVHAAARLRFGCVMSGIRRRRGARWIVEKTPLNTLRIGYLRELAPDAKFIHLLRDGVEVVGSIQRLAGAGDAMIAGRRPINRWWGCEDRKWTALVREGARRGYWPGTAGALDPHDHASRAAYEWLVSIGEVQRHREMLGDRLLEIRYDQLARSPDAALRHIGRFLNLRSIDDWIARASAMVRPGRARPQPPALRGALHDAFWTLQAQHGWLQRQPAPEAAAAEVA